MFCVYFCRRGLPTAKIYHQVMENDAALLRFYTFGRDGRCGVQQRGRCAPIVSVLTNVCVLQHRCEQKSSLSTLAADQGTCLRVHRPSQTIKQSELSSRLPLKSTAESGVFDSLSCHSPAFHRRYFPAITLTIISYLSRLIITLNNNNHSLLSLFDKLCFATCFGAS